MTIIPDHISTLSDQVRRIAKGWFLYNTEMRNTLNIAARKIDALTKSNAKASLEIKQLKAEVRRAWKSEVS